MKIWVWRITWRLRKHSIGTFSYLMVSCRRDDWNETRVEILDTCFNSALDKITNVWERLDFLLLLLLHFSLHFIPISIFPFLHLSNSYFNFRTLWKCTQRQYCWKIMQQMRMSWKGKFWPQGNKAVITIQDTHKSALFSLVCAQLRVFTEGQGKRNIVLF